MNGKGSLKAIRSPHSLVTNTSGSSSSSAEDEVKRLENAIAQRVNSPEFKALLKKRDSLKKEMPLLKEKIDEETDLLKRRALKRMLKELHYQNLDTRSQLEEYKNETAQKYVYRLNELTRDQVEAFRGESLGNGSYRTVSAKTGSREWLEQRQNGVGGSDVGSIIGTGDPKYADRNYNNVFWSKVDPILDEDVLAQSDANGGGPAARGHTWEPRIIDRFQLDNQEDFDVMTSKDSWAIKGASSAAINVDGLLSDTQDGVPNGILECKTSSRKEDWAEGVPEGYKAQTLYYMKRLGFKYGYVAVVFDDNEYAQYRLESGDGVTTKYETKPFDEYMETIENFHELTVDYKKRGETSAPGEEDEIPKKKQSSTFRNVTPSAISNLSAYRAEPESVTEQKIRAGITSGKDAHESIADLYHNFDTSTRKKNFAYIDLETDSGSEERGEIIEFGVTIRDGSNNIVREFSKVYSPDPRSLAVNGTGFEDVHGITVEDVQGKPMFSDPDNQAEVMELLKDTVLVAHNQSFEARHLGVGLDGFIEAELPILDTMHISRYLLRNGENNTLKSFVGNYGIPYENAHRALADAQMMAEGLHLFSQSPRES